jgi:hypothetical protein
VAAAAYVLRPTGWVKLVTAAGEEALRADAERADEESRAELERLREELAPGARRRPGPRPSGCGPSWTSAKKEAESLHRKLRAALSDVKRGEAALRKLRAEMESVRGEGQTQVSAAESETRRLKARLSEAEAALEATRKAAREGRSVEDMRVRLLLDTVLDAAQGLRRELALPPVSVRPAETVDAVEPGRMTPKDIAARALSENDPRDPRPVARAAAGASGRRRLQRHQDRLSPDAPGEAAAEAPRAALAARRADRRRGHLCLRRGRAGRPGAARAAARGAGAVLQTGRHRRRVDPPAGARRAAGAARHRRSTDREVADGIAKAGAPVASSRSAVLLKRLS